MKRILSVVFVLALALVLGASAVSVFTAASSEAASYPGDGYAPGTNQQFLYAEPDFETEYQQRLVISGDTYYFPLGRNTIQEYIHVNAGTSDDFYAITTHPQYFGPLRNYDNQDDAKYVLQITGLDVWDDSTNGTVDCFESGFGIIPAAYATVAPTADDPGYFRCEVFAKIINLDTGAVSNADWNGVTVYLEIPAGF